MSTTPPTLIAEPGERIDGRYRLRERLGGGGVGVVFRAEDEGDGGQDVALKFLRPELVAEERQLHRFLREFRAVSRLDHPGCVQVFAEGVDAGRRFFVMEYAGGGDLHALQKAPTEVLVPVLVRIAAALQYIHGARIVHRDLKPGNVLLTAGDPPAPKLADFGLAKLVEAGSTITESGVLMGTPAYMAPEQVTGDPVDPRTDLYALGCLIHFLFAGLPPFVSEGGAFPLMHAHLETPPPRLRVRAPDAPPALEDLTARLLAKDPALRPQRTGEVVDALRALLDDLGGATQADSIPSSAPTGRTFLYRPPFLGRDEERGQVSAWIDEAFVGERGAPEVVLLQGPAGVGKTRLLDAVRGDLARRGVVLLAASARGQGGEPFAPFPSLERAAARHTEDTDSYPEPAITEQPTLRKPFEALVRARAPAPRTAASPAAADPAQARRARAQTLAEQLVTLDEQTPVAALIEDLHDAGPGALDYLADLLAALRDTPGRPPVLLLTSRPGAVVDALRGWARTGRSRVATLELQPLGDEAVAAMVRIQLGAPDDDSLDTLIDLITRESEGNPLFVQAYLEALVDEGVLDRDHDRWVVSQDGRPSQSMPRTIDHILRERLASLGEDARRLLEVAAVVGTRFDFDLLRAVTGQPVGALLDALDEALRDGVVRSVRGPRHRDVYAFDHGKLAEVLYDDLSPSRRRAYHHATAEALVARGGEPVALIAYHHARGEDARAALAALREAGREALAAHDHVQAEAHLREALARVDQAAAADRDALHGELTAMLADALRGQGRHADAVPALRRAHQAARGTVAEARSLRKLGRSLFLAGETEAGLDALDRALRALGDRAPGGRGEVLVRFVAELAGLALGSALGFRRGDPAVLRERALAHRDLSVVNQWRNVERTAAHHLAYLRLAERLRQPEFLVDAYATNMLVSSVFGLERRANRLLARASELAERAGDQLGEVRLHTSAGMTAYLRGDMDKVRHHLDRSVELAEQVGDRFEIGYARVQRGWTNFYYGQFDDARGDFGRGLAVAEELDDRRLRADALKGQAAIANLEGRRDEARRMGEEVVESGRALGMPALEGLGLETLGTTAMLEADFAESHRRYAESLDVLLGARMVGIWSVMIPYEHTEAALCLHDLGRALSRDELLRTMRQDLRIASRNISTYPLFSRFYRMQRGCYASRRGRAAEARAELERAAAEFRAFGSPWIRAGGLLRIAYELWRLGGTREDLLARLAESGEMVRGIPGAEVPTMFHTLREHLEQHPERPSR